MLLFGDHNTIPTNMDDIVSVGFLTLKEGLPRINLEFPMKVATSDESEYDMRFADFMMNDDRAFLELMTLVFALYSQRNVYVTITKDNGYIEFVAESLSKFILERYGYPSAIINEYSDFDSINRNAFTFSLTGLANFDLDRNRYVDLMLHKYPHLVMQKGVDPNGNEYSYLPEGLLYYSRY